MRPGPTHLLQQHALKLKNRDPHPALLLPTVLAMRGCSGTCLVTAPVVGQSTTHLDTRPTRILSSVPSSIDRREEPAILREVRPLRHTSVEMELQAAVAPPTAMMTLLGVSRKEPQSRPHLVDLFPTATQVARHARVSTTLALLARLE